MATTMAQKKLVISCILHVLWREAKTAMKMKTKEVEKG
jgi:hypothetical protein